MTYFKLGVSGEGYAFFLPDSYKKDERIIGTGVRRTINGKAKRDVITTKHQFTIVFEFVSELECASLYEQFKKNINEGKTLTFADDSGVEWQVMWGQDNFGLSDRVNNSDVYWTGQIVLEEV